MLTILPATVDDARFVARGVCMALHHEVEGAELDKVAAICARQDVLYSYRHALIAWEESELPQNEASQPQGSVQPRRVPIGLCLCYDGSIYHEMRKFTFSLFSSEGNEAMDLEHAEDETEAGEYYVDSLAVLPEWRGRSVGRKLLEAQFEKARSECFSCVTLLVDPTNPPAQQLYRKVGFEDGGERYAFGQIFWRWQKKLQ